MLWSQLGDYAMLSLSSARQIDLIKVRCLEPCSRHLAQKIAPSELKECVLSTPFSSVIPHKEIPAGTPHSTLPLCYHSRHHHASPRSPVAPRVRAFANIPAFKSERSRKRHNAAEGLAATGLTSSRRRSAPSSGRRGKLLSLLCARSKREKGKGWVTGRFDARGTVPQHPCENIFIPGNLCRSYSSFLAGFNSLLLRPPSPF